MPASVRLANWALRGLGKGVSAAAKAGYNTYKERSNERYEDSATEVIHSVVFGGVMPTPGHPLPPQRTTSLAPDELEAFVSACDGLTDRGIELPPYVRSFASAFFIKIKKKK